MVGPPEDSLDGLGREVACSVRTDLAEYSANSCWLGSNVFVVHTVARAAPTCKAPKPSECEAISGFLSKLISSIVLTAAASSSDCVEWREVYSTRNPSPLRSSRSS